VRAWVVQKPADTMQNQMYVVRSTGYAIVPAAGATPQGIRTVAQFGYWQTPSMRETAFARPAAPTSDDELTTGSIVFVPVLGNTCRQNLIDNRTWQVREVGTVPCNEALAASAQRRSGAAPATRFDIIRESFRKSSP